MSVKSAIFELSCQECVTFLMDYLDGELVLETRAAFEDHLKICPNCEIYLDNYVKATRLAGNAKLGKPNAEDDSGRLSFLQRILDAANTQRPKKVSYPSTKAAPSFQHVATSAFDFDETLVRLRHAIAAEGLMMLHELTPQAVMREAGYEILPARQLLFFHPRYVETILQIEPSALIEFPLKFAVMQMPDGAVIVRYLDVRMQTDRYAGLVDLAKDLAAKCARILSQIATPQPG
jgi:uncharacterized protein (DUF302 family)